MTYSIGRLKTLEQVRAPNTLSADWSISANKEFVQKIILDLSMGGDLFLFLKLKPFVSIEESLLAELTTEEGKPSILASEISTIFGKFDWNMKLSVGGVYLANIVKIRAVVGYESSVLLDTIKSVIKKLD